MKSKILHIAGGAAIQKLYQHIFDHLSREGTVQDIYVPCNTHDKVGANQVDISGVRYKYVAVTGVVDRILFFPKLKKHFAKLIEFFHPRDYDFCFAYTVMTDGSLAYKLNKLYGTPYSVFVRNTDINIFYKHFFWLRPFFKKVLKNAVYINFPNPSYRDRLYGMLTPSLVTQLEQKTYIVPNGIDDFWHENKIEIHKKRTDDEPFKLLFVGKVEKNKNVHNIIKSLRMLNDNGYNFQLTLVGSINSSMKTDLESWQKEFGNKLTVKGSIIDKERLLHEYKSADLFVMPSFTETFGLVYIEALTQGTPIVYTKGEGVSGLFDHLQNGIEIENPHDASELTRKILLISQNYIRYAEGAIGSSEPFQWGTIVTNCYLKQINDYEKGKNC